VPTLCALIAIKTRRYYEGATTQTSPGLLVLFLISFGVRSRATCNLMYLRFLYSVPEGPRRCDARLLVTPYC
jgi:hypothetical protein